MRHAATASATAWQSTFGCIALVPRTHTSEDLKRQDTLHLSQPNTLEYASLCFSHNKLANRLKNTIASPVMPPSVVKTNGVKHPRSMSLTLCPSSLRFWFHAACILKTILIGGRKMRMGKISVYQKMHLDVQYLNVQTSKCALSSVFADGGRIQLFVYLAEQNALS